MRKKVSIIIPCYNQAKFVSETIESALKQTYENLEIVIVNDASTDNSVEIIKSYVDKYANIAFINQSVNGGLSNSRNIAIEAATGEYILPLDSDDIIAPSYVEKAAKILDENPQIGMVYCEAEFFGAKNGKWELCEYNKDNFIFNNCIFCSALYRKSTWLQAGKYNLNMNLGYEDYDMWLSFIELGFEPYRIPEVLFYYRQHEKGSMVAETNKKLDIVFKQILNNHPKLYLNSDKVVEKLFLSDFAIRKKYQKYKKLFNLILIVAGIELLLFVLLFVFVWRIQ